jgi:hypothetical protein
MNTLAEPLLLWPVMIPTHFDIPLRKKQAVGMKATRGLIHEDTQDVVDLAVAAYRL